MNMDVVVNYYQQVILSSGMVIAEDLENLTFPNSYSRFEEWKRQHLSVLTGTIVLGIMSFLSKNFTLPAIECGIKIVLPITANLQLLIHIERFKKSITKLISSLNLVSKKYSETHDLVKSFQTRFVEGNKKGKNVILSVHEDKVMSLSILICSFELNLRKSTVMIMRKLIEVVKDLYQTDCDYLKELDSIPPMESKNIDHALLIIDAAKARFVLIRSHLLTLIYMAVSLNNNVELLKNVIFNDIQNLVDDINKGVGKIDDKISQIKYPVFSPLDLTNLVSIETREKPYVRILIKTINQLNLKASHTMNDLKLLVDASEKVKSVDEFRTIEEKTSKLAKMLKECHCSCVEMRKLLEVINNKGSNFSELPKIQQIENLQGEIKVTYEKIYEPNDEEVEILQEFGDEISDDDIEEYDESTKQPILIELKQCQAFLDRQLKYHTMKKSKQLKVKECIDDEITSLDIENVRNSDSSQSAIETNVVAGTSAIRVPPPPPPMLIDITSDETPRSALSDSIKDVLSTKFVQRSEDTFQ